MLSVVGAKFWGEHVIVAYANQHTDRLFTLSKIYIFSTRYDSKVVVAHISHTITCVLRLI